MLKHRSVLGLVVVVAGLASLCRAQLIDPDADVTYHPASTATAEALLTAQILGVRDTVVGAYAADPDPYDPADDDYYSDSHTKVFADLEAGAVGIFSLDQFDPTRTLPNTDTRVGKLRGAMLYLTVHLKRGRLVIDAETRRAITAATLQIGANLRVSNASLGVDFFASPHAEATGSLTGDVYRHGDTAVPYDPYDGQWPDPRLSEAELDLYSTGPDKLAAIIDPNDPNNSFVYAPIFVDLRGPDADAMALFTGSGTVDFAYFSSPYADVDFSPNQIANVWPSTVTFDLEARLVYLYADAIPEPASMGLICAALAPVLARRFRRRMLPRTALGSAIKTE